MTPQQARNVVAILQKDPFFYRNFGVWWWHVKSELKRNEFGPDQLYFLGDYTDVSAQRFYSDLTTVELDNEAYEQQWNHTFHKFNNNMSFTPDGDPYLVLDEDVE